VSLIRARTAPRLAPFGRRARPAAFGPGRPVLTHHKVAGRSEGLTSRRGAGHSSPSLPPSAARSRSRQFSSWAVRAEGGGPPNRGSSRFGQSRWCPYSVLPSGDSVHRAPQAGHQNSPGPSVERFCPLFSSLPRLTADHLRGADRRHPPAHPVKGQAGGAKRQRQQNQMHCMEPQPLHQRVGRWVGRESKSRIRNSHDSRDSKPAAGRHTTQRSVFGDARKANTRR